MFDPSFAIARAVASLCVTLGLIVITAWAWKRYGQPFSHKLGLAQSSGAPLKRLSVIETKRLDATTSLHLVRVDDTEHLIAATASQTTLIHSRTQVEAPQKNSQKSTKVKA